MSTPDLPHCSGGGEQEIQCWFDRALSLQEQAGFAPIPERFGCGKWEREKPETKRAALLRQARDFYGRARRLAERRGEILNNEAQVHAELGDSQTAGALFEAAVGLADDPLRPFYRSNYGDFLRQEGEWERAVTQYRLVLEEEPEDFLAHTRLAHILADCQPTNLPEHLWYVSERGQALWGQEIAIEMLRKEGLPGDLQRELLILLIRSLAERPEPSEGFVGSTVAETLASLSQHESIGQAAQEVLLLYAGRSFKPEEYGWWAGTRERRIGWEERSPRVAFRRLIRAIGESFRKRGQFEPAARYFLLAAMLTSEEPDLLASRLLAAVSSSTGDAEALDRLVAWNEPLLLKSSAPTLIEVYRYRHDLGLLYSHRNQWGDLNKPTSAIYQLERAKDLVATLAAAGSEKPGFVFDGRVYSHLASGYLATDSREAAQSTLLELVEAYRQQGLAAEADALRAKLQAGRARRMQDRQRAVFDDPPGRLTDFTTEPPEPP
ncbi:MAG TPA: hypothetical protein VF179_10875 [Thermoanaerobaculia bacterium]|nr:hypothetical protein [Thermoanaerobaculia bacterium]